VTTLLVEYTVDTTKGILRRLDLHQVDGLTEAGAGCDLGSIDGSSASGDDLSASSVDGICVKYHITYLCKQET